jgi:3-carboxy-cis,cis-muconate cycloisomerase
VCAGASIITGIDTNPLTMLANVRRLRSLCLEEGVDLVGVAPTTSGTRPALGRGTAHEVVHHACEVALAEGIHLRAALARDSRATAILDAAGIARLTDPAGYLGAAEAAIDAVLARL